MTTLEGYPLEINRVNCIAADKNVYLVPHHSEDVTLSPRRAYRNGGITRVLKRSVDVSLQYSPAPKLTWPLSEWWYRRFATKRYREMDSPLDPFKICRTSPDEIDRHTRREYPPYADRWNLIGSIKTGDWDQRITVFEDLEHVGPPPELFLGDSFEKSVLFRSFKNHFYNDLAWEETELIQRVMELLDKRLRVPPWHECKSVADVHDRCRWLDELYTTIQTQGYKSQRELFGHADGPDYFREAVENEITVDIGRNGEALLVSGKHRLAIAKLLDVKRVPVVVCVRHRNWAKKRDVAYQQGDTSHFDFVEWG